jgi:hypothetical protein
MTTQEEIESLAEECRGHGGDPETCDCSSALQGRHLLQMNSKEKGKYAQQAGGWGFCGDTTDVLPSEIYKAERGSFGPILRPMDLKTDNPVPLPGSVSDQIANEVSSFWKLGSKFKDVGMLHKRGILLFGPAGAGKTSTACTIGRRVVKENGIVFVLVNGDFANLQVAIREVRSREPLRPIVNIIEDIDELVENGQEENLLSFLDGEDQVDHVCHIGTTNSLEKMGGRLVNRPSRFDLVIEVGMPSLVERHMYLKAKIGDTTEAKQWAEMTQDMSVAHLRELVVGVKCMSEEPEKVLKRLRDMMARKIPDASN